jgi:hypothetical protein
MGILGIRKASMEETQAFLGGSLLISTPFNRPASGPAQPAAGTAGDPVTDSAKADEDEGQSVRSDPARPLSPPTVGSDVNEESVGQPSPSHPLPGD